MRIALSRTLPFLIYLVLATSAAAEDDKFSGHYQGRIGDTPATLDLRVSGSMVTGRMTRHDTTEIELNGTSDEERIVGAATTGRGAGFFEAYREFGALIVVIRERGTVTGQPVEIRAEFFPADALPGTEANAAGATQRDQGLIGTWMMRGFGRRGDMVLPVTTNMTLAASGDFSVASEPADESKRGEWRSRDGKLEFRPGNSQSWSVLGEYLLHGDRLILILPGNETQVWTRGN